MISSGTNESSSSRDTDSVVRIKRNYTKLVPQRCLSVLNLSFISVAQPQKFGNKEFDEQSRLATCIPSEHTTADAIRDTPAADIKQETPA